MPLTNKAIQDHGSELVFHELVTFPNFTPQKKKWHKDSWKWHNYFILLCKKNKALFTSIISSHKAGYFLTKR